ncbi:unnamed protein product [Ambrosiozyma monospora]|uniref:Unnamed protein product n=1 Tax=Ambrosiozyma monospora TaxID=43982 RepID=A0ACB5U7P8_AMBMO|nr:unnamed protein product [Ambrosiozyma monospora]
MEVMNCPEKYNERICQLMSRSKINVLVLDSNEVSFNKTLSSLDKRAYITKIEDSKLAAYLKTDVSTLTALLSSNGIDAKHIKVLRLAPTIHIPLGGIKVTETMELEGIKNCYAAGEIVGGIHGSKMIIGTALLSCVVFGLIAADTATSFILSKLSNKASNRSAIDRLTQLQNHLNPSNSNEIIPEQFKIPDDEYQIEEISKHNSKDDCWLVVKNVVLDVTQFMSNHPGGFNAIKVNGGYDVSASFNMLHDDGMILKYAKNCIIGRVQGTIPYLELVDLD